MIKLSVISGTDVAVAGGLSRSLSNGETLSGGLFG